MYKSMGPDRMHPWDLRELAGVTVRPLPVIRMFWCSGRSLLLGRKKRWQAFSRRTTKRIQEK